MSLDLNQASSEQTIFGPGAIPPGSCVVVRLHIRYPQETGKIQGELPEITVTGKGTHQLQCLLEVVTGQYAGRKIYHNFTVKKGTEEGQIRAYNMSMTQLRLIVEFARGIDENDNSPQANAARQIELAELEGVEFVVMVDCEKSKEKTSDGANYYVNNKIKKIITQKDPELEDCLKFGEIISDKPVPVYPTVSSVGGYGYGARTGAAPTPSWAQRAAAPQNANTNRTWGQQQRSWGQQNTAKTPPPPPMQAAPAQPQQDSVPF